MIEQLDDPQSGHSFALSQQISEWCWTETMRTEALERSIQDAVAQLAGSTLIDIRVGVFVVDFVFLSDALTITARITKKFGFSFAENRRMTFDPTLETHDLLVESSEFVFLRAPQIFM